MMKIQSKKSSRTMKRALALVMSLALAMSTFAVSPSVDAASTKKPKLSVKKKTLYYNKAGKKSYTLKVKKTKKVKKITKTTWKTSKKSVVKITKKKKTSVKLTAKKAGKATITAKVKYTRKGSKKVRKVTLKCKVTSKKYNVGTGVVTPTPTNGTVTPTPSGTTATNTPAAATDTPVPATNTPVPATDTPAAATDTPVPATATPEPVATTVELDKEDAFLGVAEGLNSVTVSAVVKDQYGNTMEGQTITFKSDNPEVASVDEKGVVTALKEGIARITASVGEVESKAVIITVDAVAPTTTTTAVEDYKTITVAFSEKVKDAKLDVKVYQDSSKTAMDTVTAKLAEDGKSLILSNSKAFAAAEYQIVINGLTDEAGNQIAKDTEAYVTKAASVVASFLGVNKEAPAPYNASDFVPGVTKVYYSVEDQYGEAMDNANIAGANISVSAKIDATDFPIDAALGAALEPGSKRAYINLTNYQTMTEGKVITISLTNTVGGKEYKSNITVTLVSSAGLGTATSIESFTAQAKDGCVANEGTAEAPVFTLATAANTAQNYFEINAKLLDKFLYPAVTGKITYVSSNKDVLMVGGPIDGDHSSDSEFGSSFTTTMDTDGTNQTIPVRIKGAGTATIRAYLENNDEVSAKIDVTIKAVPLTSITVGSRVNTGGNTALTNGVGNYYPVTLSPTAAETGLGAADLKAEAVTGADKVEKIEVIKATAADATNLGLTANQLYVNLVPKANGAENEIGFKVSYEKVTSGEVQKSKSAPEKKISSIAITPFKANDVMNTKTAKTEVILYNAQGENISAFGVSGAPASGQVQVTGGSQATNVISAVAYSYSTDDKKGYMTVTTAAKGTAEVYLTSGSKSATLSVTVVDAPVVTTANFGSQISIINNDTKDITNDTTRAKTGGKYYTVVEPVFKDQYGHVMQLTATEYGTAFEALSGDQVEVTGTVAAGNVAIELFKTSGQNAAVASGSDVVKYVGIATNVTADADKTKDATRTLGTIAVKFVKKSAAAGTAPYATLRAKVTPDRQVAVLKDKYNTKMALAVGGASFANLVTVDQYGVQIAEGNIAANMENASGTVIVKAVNNASVTRVDIGKYYVTINGIGVGTDTVRLYYDLDGSGNYTAGTDPSYTIDVTVKAVTDIASLSINDDVTVVGGAGYKNTNVYGIGDSKIKLTAVAKDSAGNALTPSAGDLTWSVEAVDLKDYTNPGAPTTASNAGISDFSWEAADSWEATSKRLVIPHDVSAVVRGTVTVKVTNMSTGVETLKTLTISGATPVAQKDTYYLSKETDIAKAGAATTSIDVENNGYLYLYAKDQYGNTIAARSDMDKLTTGFTDATVAGAGLETDNGGANRLNIYAVKKGETQMNVALSGGLNQGNLAAVKVTVKKADDVKMPPIVIDATSLSSSDYVAVDGITFTAGVLEVTTAGQYNKAVAFKTPSLSGYKKVTVALEADADLDDQKFAVYSNNSGVTIYNAPKIGEGQELTWTETAQDSGVFTATMVVNLPSDVANATKCIAVGFDNGASVAANAAVTIKTITFE